MPCTSLRRSHRPVNVHNVGLEAGSTVAYLRDRVLRNDKWFDSSWVVLYSWLHETRYALGGRCAQSCSGKAIYELKLCDSYLWMQGGQGLL